MARSHGRTHGYPVTPHFVNCSYSEPRHLNFASHLITFMWDVLVNCQSLSSASVCWSRKWRVSFQRKKENLGAQISNYYLEWPVWPDWAIYWTLGNFSKKWGRQFFEGQTFGATECFELNFSWYYRSWILNINISVTYRLHRRGNVVSCPSRAQPVNPTREEVTFPGTKTCGKIKKADFWSETFLSNFRSWSSRLTTGNKFYELANCSSYCNVVTKCSIFCYAVTVTGTAETVTCDFVDRQIRRFIDRDRCLDETRTK